MTPGSASGVTPGDIWGTVRDAIEAGFLPAVLHLHPAWVILLGVPKTLGSVCTRLVNSRGSSLLRIWAVTRSAGALAVVSPVDIAPQGITHRHCPSPLRLAFAGLSRRKAWPQASLDTHWTRWTCMGQASALCLRDLCGQVGRTETHCSAPTPAAATPRTPAQTPEVWPSWAASFPPSNSVTSAAHRPISRRGEQRWGWRLGRPGAVPAQGAVKCSRSG